jgi:hypothetical protein
MATEKTDAVILGVGLRRNSGCRARQGRHKGHRSQARSTARHRGPSGIEDISAANATILSRVFETFADAWSLNRSAKGNH